MTTEVKLVREELVIVAPGFQPPDWPVPYGSVSNHTAIGIGGKLYATKDWVDRTEAERAAWANRGWFRKLLSLPPKRSRA